MSILIAPTAYKGTLSPIEATEAIAAGLKETGRRLSLDLCPIADGGNGWAEVWYFHAAQQGLKAEWVPCTVRDPLRRPVEASYVLMEESIAVIESASASGLHLLRPEERDPLQTSTEGVGDLIRHAVESGAQEIWLGLGGSATNEGGTGVLRALGFEFLEAGGQPIPPGGAGLLNLAKIRSPENLITGKLRGFLCACDVQNPLYGEQGAAYVFAPQKGASPEGVLLLDEGLRRFAEVVRRDLGVVLEGVPGMGAAGGLSAGLVAGLHAQLISGIGFLLEKVGWQERLGACDLLITGEGRVDAQTLMGKGVGELVRYAVALGKPVWLLAGSRGEGWESLVQLPNVRLWIVAELVPDQEPKQALQATALLIGQNGNLGN